VQRQVLYLGEINDSQREAWCEVIEAFDEGSQRPTQLALFPAERAMPEHAKGYGVQVRLDRMQLHRPRQWGACWSACTLMGLSRWLFWQSLVEQKGLHFPYFAVGRSADFAVGLFNVTKPPCARRRF
jgi:hypothetical protein